MRAARNDGGLAFPCEWDAQLGMTLRDWFAGQALTGMLNSKAISHLNHDVQAETAYRYADAMIAARKGADQ